MRLIGQLLRWSCFGWVTTVAVTLLYLALTDRSLGDALFGGALFASVCLVGAGAMSFGGGGFVSSNVHTRALRRHEHERWEEEGAILTPFGAALLVVPQLIGVAILVSNAQV